MGWGLDVHWARRRGRARLADRRRRRHADRPHAAPGGQRLRRATRPRREARALPRRPRPTCAATRSRTLADRTGEGRRRRASSIRAPHDPVLGIWAHRQALAARDAGADVRVLVLHRPVPRGRAPARRAGRAAHAGLASRGTPSSTASTCATCPFLAAAALAQLRVAGAPGRRRRWRRPAPAAPEFPYDLVHAHNAVPGGRRRAARARIARAARRLGPRRRRLLHRAAPPGGERAVRRAFGAARLVLANSAGIEDEARAPRRARDAGACAWAPTSREQPSHKAPRPDARHRRPPRRAQAPRRRRARAVAAARPPPAAALPRHRRRPRARAARRGSPASWAWPTASSSPASCRARRRSAARRAAHVFVMPSVDEAFGVAYVEAMAGGLPAVGARGEAGPEEIAAAGDGHAPRPARRRRGAGGRARRAAGRARATCSSSAPRARATVARAFTWELLRARDGRRPTRTRCGDAGRSSSSPTTSRPIASARSARCTSACRSSSRCSAGARTTRRRASTTPACRSAASASARSTRWPRAGATRAVVARHGRAASRCPPPSSARAARSVPFVLWSALWARPAHPGAPAPRARCCATSTAAPTPSSTYGPHVTAYAARLGARSVARRAPGRRQRLLGDAGRRRRAARRSRRCSSGATCPRRGSAVLRRGVAAGGARRRPPERRRRRRPWSPPSRSATPTPAATFWSYRRSPPATSSSRGGSSPTKP